MSWSGWLLAYEAPLRLGCFIGVFVLMALWEWHSPCRRQRFGRWLRWSNNLALVALNSLLLRWLFPLAAVGLAQSVADSGFGLFNWLNWPLWLEGVLAVVLLDLLIYLQHVVFHKVPLLWRLHQVHHADPDYDVTTGARFHPLEILLSMLLKMLAICLLGPAAVVVLLFEVLLNASAMFNHGNVSLPAGVDRWLRRLLVTPDMHRVHHSRIPRETDSNYGFALALWDRLFHTYTPEPEAGQQGMQIGLNGRDDPRRVCRLDGLLSMPWR
ncbi:sterol desaturase family protein [Neptuniibacter halophilus]|uniref:sterol desaturase family protein n=1 Tax=Neptuniibacter halophilus TaxID=651666 RepID=UPI0025722FAA|nr:sterol desaturase family protein [Neptuniibacter halophilus]